MPASTGQLGERQFEADLRHECTHALLHAALPYVPLWLDEGLASLYEECEFSADELRLVGLENWRGAALRGAMRAGILRSIEELAEASGRATARELQAETGPAY